MQFPTQNDMQRNASLGGISDSLKGLNERIDQEKAARAKAEKKTRRLAVASLVISALTLVATVLFGVFELIA